MRRALKFKALVLGLSWSIIFMHSIVPHMHANHSSLDFHESTSCGFDTCSDHQEEGLHDLDADLISLPDNHNHSSVCHFNPNLFSQLNIDVSFLHVSNFEVVTALATIDITYCVTAPKSNKPPLLTCSLLRGPPIA